MADPYKTTSGWGFVFDAPKRGDGTRMQIRRHGFRTKKDAQVEMDRLRRAYSVRGYTGGTRTVAEAADEFIDILRVEGRLEDETIRGYEQKLRLHIVPALGAMNMQEVSAGDLRRLYTRLLGEGLSPRTVELVHTTLSKLFKYAINELEILPEGSRPPTAKVKPPRPQPGSGEKTAWTADELTRFLAAVEPRGDYPMWVTFAHTGARLGEVVALNWGDFDRANGVLAVRRAQKRDMSLGATKNRQAREVALTAANWEVLSGRWLQQVDDWAGDLGWTVSPDTPLFCRPDGSRLRKDDVSRLFPTLIPDGVRPITLHELRHSHGSMLVRAGVPIDEVAERLGHDPAVLLRTYSHVVGGQRRRAADQFTAALPANT